MSAEPIAVDDEPVVDPVPEDWAAMIEEAHKAIDRALTDEDGYRIPPVCEQAPDLWFLDRKTDEDFNPKAACVGCPALKECGAFAIIAGMDFGVWGGQYGLGRGGIAVRRARLLTWTAEP